MGHGGGVSFVLTNLSRGIHLHLKKSLLWHFILYTSNHSCDIPVLNASVILCFITAVLFVIEDCSFVLDNHHFGGSSESSFCVSLESRMDRIF